MDTKKYFSLFEDADYNRHEIVFPNRLTKEILEFGKIITLGDFQERIYSHKVLSFPSLVLALSFSNFLVAFGWEKIDKITFFFNLLDNEG